MPVSSRGEFLQGMTLIPWLAAKTTKVRIGMSIIDTPYRSPGVLAAEIATQDQLSGGRINVGVGSGWMPEEFAAASASHIFPKRHKHVRETIEIMQGIWTNELFEYHGEFADFDKCGFGAKPVQKPHPPIFFSGLRDPKRSASRIAKYGLAGWIGIQDSPDEIKKWRGEIQRELEELGSSRSVDDLEICSMCWFVITTRRHGSDAGREGQQPVGGIRRPDHRHPQALQGGRPDDAAPLAPVRRRAVGEDDGRHEDPEERDHAQGRRHVVPKARRSGLSEAQ